ncbi:TolC family protein [bacterium]|nr:TolC family protein [bacterium]
MIIFFVAALASLSTFAIERHGLDDFVRLALSNGDAVKIQQAQVAFAEGREDFARSKRWFTGSVEALVAPVPAASGNALDSETNWNDWGGFIGTSIEIKQPIFTFGAIPSAIEAAQYGVEAERALLEKEKWSIRYEIAELYYGYQLAFELSQLGEDVVKKLEGASNKLSKNSSSYKDLTMALADVRSKLMEAKNGKEQARLAMAWKIGKLSEPTVYWDQSNLKSREFTLRDLERYKELLKMHRADWSALEAETKAKKKLFEVEQGLSFPLLFFYAKGQMNWAENRKNDSAGPFAYDPSNAKSGIVGLGIKWDLDFMEKGAKRSQARAEYLKASSKKGYYQQGMMVEIEKKFMDAEFRKKSLEHFSEAEKIASKIYRDALVSYGLKNITGRQLLDKMGQYGKLKQQYLDAVYRYNLATHDLEKTIGSLE